jgi:RNA polymerase sigma-70 factor (ECF subfamily)
MTLEILNTASDEELVSAIKNSDHCAFEVFFRRHFESIYHYIWQFIRNEEAANDLTQNTFVKIWEIRKMLDPDKSTAAFVQAIARNQALSWLRMPRNRHLSLEEYDFPEEDTKLENDELIRKLHNVIKELKEPLRVVINLRLRGLKDKEIADLLNVSIATVDKRKSKAFRIIRERLQPLPMAF